MGAGKVLIGATAYEMKGGKPLVNNTAYKILYGKNNVNGTNYTISFARLPAELQEVEYLQSTGTQFINTHYSWTTNNIRIIADIAYLTSGWAYGHENNSGRADRWSGVFVPGGANVYALAGSTDLASGDIATTKGVRYLDEIICSNGVIVFNRNNVQLSYRNYAGTVATTTNFGIFKAIYQNGSANGGSSKIYSFKMYDNGALVRNFIPCYRKADNVAGMYDLVTHAFYTNAGSGSFTVGPNV